MVLRYSPGASLRREPVGIAACNQKLSQCDARRVVDAENYDGRSSLRCESTHPGTFPEEMLLPHIPPGIEQLTNQASYRIDARQIRTLESIAEKARECEVAGDRQPAMFLRENVLDLKPWAIKALGHSAILTARSRPLPHQISQGDIHVLIAGGRLEREPRFGLDEIDNVGDADVAVDLRFFIRRQRAGAGFGR